jgi:hypothetical protein
VFIARYVIREVAKKLIIQTLIYLGKSIFQREAILGEKS